AVADGLASGGQVLFVGLAAAVFQGGDVHEQLFFEVVQEQAGAGAHHRVGRHALRVRETLVDVFVDDVGLLQDQVTLDQDGHLAIRVHDRDVFGFVVQVDVADFEIHSFFEEHKAAALRKRAGGSGIEHHHGGESLYEKRKASAANLANAGPDYQGGAGGQQPDRDYELAPKCIASPNCAAGRAFSERVSSRKRSGAKPPVGTGPGTTAPRR